MSPKKGGLSWKKTNNVKPQKETTIVPATEIYQTDKILNQIQQEIYLNNLQLHASSLRDSNSSLMIMTGRLCGRKVTILIDSGASTNFINNNLLKSLPPELLPQPNSPHIKIQLANKSLINGVLVPSLPLRVKDFSKHIDFIAAPIGYDIILGKTWLSSENPDIDWSTNSLSFRCGTKEIWHCRSAQQHYVNSITLSLTAATKLIKQPNVKAWICHLKDEDLQEAVDKLIDTKFKNITDQNEADKEILSKLPIGVQKLVDKFPKPFMEYTGIGPVRPNDHCIEVDPHETPPFRPIYPMSEDELQTLKKELTALLNSGRIRPSVSPFGAPVFFVYTEDKMRLVVDFRALNRITRRNSAALPNIQEILDQLSGAKYFTKLDLASGFHQIRVKEEDVPKTAFRTKYGHFEWVVMPFGLCNAPSTFQSTMNDIFRDYIDVFLTVYIDDILIFSHTYDEHLIHIEKVLQRLDDHNLHVRLHKCAFLLTELSYLGFSISHNNIKVLESRISTLKSFPLPPTVTLLRSFIGLANTVHRFVPNHAALLGPLSDLLKGAPGKKGSQAAVQWTPELEKKFYVVRDAIASPETLGVFKPGQVVHLFTDWSENAIGSFIGQVDNGVIRPISYYSRKCNKSERVYHPYHGEILALVESLRVHRHYLYGQKIKAYVDHQSLRHILNQPRLKPLHQRWLTDLLAYDFEVEWIPGEWNFISDILSRSSLTKDIQTQYDVDDLELLPVENNVITSAVSDLQGRVRTATADDEELISIISYLTVEDKSILSQLPIGVQISKYSYSDGLLYFENRLVIPHKMRREVFDSCHTSHIHNSWFKVYERVTRNFHWYNIEGDIKKWCKSCDSCQRNNISHKLKFGLLNPLPIPEKKGDILSVDFMVGLPSSNGFDAITVWVDSLTKRTFIYASKTTDDTYIMAERFVRNVWRLGILPRHIISDRDPKFVSDLWTQICNVLNINRILSSSNHPQTDGQTENKNSWIISVLRHYVNFRQSDWFNFLHLVEYGINDSVNVSTGYTPFYLETGQHPTSILDINLPQKPPLKLDEMKILLKLVKANIAHAQSIQSYYANRHRLESTFKIGDLVLVDINKAVPPSESGRPSEKLSCRFSGPYKIIDQVGTSFVLQLPQTWKIHNLFHPEKLRYYYYDGDSDPLAGVPVYARHIEALIAHRRLGVSKQKPQGSSSQYLVKWSGHNRRYNCWMDASSLPQHLIQHFSSSLH